MVYKIRDLSKKFGKYYALKNIDLDIEQNEKIVIIGPSGSGKTTDKHMCVHTHTQKLPSCTKLVQLINLYPAYLKKGTMWELQVKFYLRQNEGYIPANSTLNSPKKLLRGRGGLLVYM